MGGAFAALWITAALCFVAFALLWPPYSQGKFDKFFAKKPKKVKDADAWTAGYKDMARAMMWNVDGQTVRDEDYVIVKEGRKKRIKLRQGEFQILNREPELVAKFNPALGRTSAKYIGSKNAQDWYDYRVGGLKFLADMDDYQTEVSENKRTIAARKAGVAREDAQYLASKAALTELRSSGFVVTDDHEQFERDFKELEG